MHLNNTWGRGWKSAPECCTIPYVYVPTSINVSAYSTPALKRNLYGQTCHPRIVVAQSSEGNRMCLDVGRMSRYRIWIWFKTPFESGSDQMWKNKTDLMQIFCVLCHVCNKFQSVSDVSKNPDFFCASVNAALYTWFLQVL